MGYQTIFKRYELKYLISNETKNKILSAAIPYLRPDSYGRSTVRNIYFDTDNYRLIRRSIERPLYKEKLRVRSYSRAGKKDKVFVELKKKYDSVVYKRRVLMSFGDALSWLSGGTMHIDSQIEREIDYFISYYGRLEPRVLLSYDREAYYDSHNSDFRVTFDSNILCRRDNITLDGDIYGVPILDKDMVLMELKTGTAIPLWMTELLSENRLYKTSYSKYGTAYENLIFGKE